MLLKKMTRRKFIQKFGVLNSFLLSGIFKLQNIYGAIDNHFSNSEIYLARNGTPAQNLEKVIEMLGGIESVIDREAIVIIKTNAQHYNQGSPNLAATKRFIELILSIPGFSGEVIIADNNHLGGATPWNYAAWKEMYEINSDITGVFNLSDLVDYFHGHGYLNVTKCHWIDVSRGANRVNGPDEGDGYVYRTDIVCDNGATDADYRATIMTYPIFTSSYSGVTIDFKNGAWQNGNYTGQPVKFINMAALCYHGLYTGVTSAIKNYLGISDLSGGADPYNNGILTENYYNFHSFPFNKWSAGPVTGMLGKEVGTFLLTIRSADLNITTAEWVGWGDRRDITKAEQNKTVLASRDPVALDYYASKYVLYPAALTHSASLADYLNPDRQDLPLRQYLEKCNELGIGTLNEEDMIVHLFDFATVSVNMIVFEANFIEDRVELLWKTATGKENYGFEVQKSQDGIYFEPLGFVKGKATYSTANAYWFVDLNISPGVYYYRLKQINLNGMFQFSQAVKVEVFLPKKINLRQNYPNPFKGTTVISFALPQANDVELRIFNINGKEIRKLVYETRQPGFYNVLWDGKDGRGREVASGIYLCELRVAGNRLTKRLTLMK